MSSTLPSYNEKPLSRSRALYLGTSLFSTSANKLDESKLTLEQLQKTISERYPTDNSQFSKGVETWLSIFTNGLQMEHSASSDSPQISALFYYPIKSLVYCGALRFIHSNNNTTGKFVPLDTDIAQTKENSINPALFIVLLKGIDSVTKSEIIETNVFVVGTKDISLSLVDSCQQAYMKSKVSRNEFYKKYGNIPVVFCLKDDLLKKKDKRIVVKHFDLSGYFYATENTDIDYWQLFEGDEDLEAVKYQVDNNSNNNTEDVGEYSEIVKSSDEVASRPEYIDPYEKSENLIGVDRRVDPETGQNIYVRYLRENAEEDKVDFEGLMSPRVGDKLPAAVFREERTPSPIVYERYIKKKAPQVIIKEIHVEEEAPAPIKYVKKKPQAYHNQIMVDKSAVKKNAVDENSSSLEEGVKKSVPKDKEKVKRSSRRDKNVEPFSPPPPANRQSIYSDMTTPEPPVRKSSSKQPTSKPGYASQSQNNKTYTNQSSINKMPQPQPQPHPSEISSANGQVQYKDFNPYAGYANYNGVPTPVRNQQQLPYQSQQPNNGSVRYSNPNMYSGHATFMNNTYNTDSRYASHQNKSSYRSNSQQYHSHRNVVDEKRGGSNYYDKYDKHHTYNSRTQNNYQNESRDYRGDNMERKKKIYVVHENELDLLKAKLRVTHKNKKIVIVDESELDTLKGRIFGDNDHVQEKSTHYHSRRYE